MKIVNQPLINSHPFFHALPGFIGLARDWDFLKKSKEDIQIVAHDLMTNRSLWEWADAFNEKIDQDWPLKNHVLLGYSLGGRLALHALIRRPKMWQAAVIVSAHPGLTDINDKVSRIHKDELWAKRFESEPWDQLIENWNAQPAFETCSKGLFNREEDNYCRAQLAHALRVWSLGAQDDLRTSLAALPVPILWVVGERDRPFVQLAQSLSFFHPLSQVWVVKNAGHRAPWEQKKAFQQKIQWFLRACSESSIG